LSLPLSEQLDLVAELRDLLREGGNGGHLEGLLEDENGGGEDYEDEAERA
jgi:hypothetical protein